MFILNLLRGRHAPYAPKLELSEFNVENVTKYFAIIADLFLYSNKNAQLATS